MKATMKTSLDLGPILQLRDGVPQDISERLGKQIASDIGRRIRNDNVTVDGERIDANSEFTQRVKELEGRPNIPLVNTGAMTEPAAWEVKGGQQGLSLEILPEHQGKWDNIVSIAEKTGRNWKKSFGIGVMEFRAVAAAIKNWIARLGVK